MRLIFMGTSELAAAALAALLDAGHHIVCVYTQPPRPAGRGKRETRSPVHQLAEERGLAVRTPASLKDADVQRDFAALEADVAVVASYGLILPKEVLDAPRHGCLNIHASLLPRWRGASPIQHAILAGDAETGVTIMQMDEGLDTGPMLLSRAVPITAETTSQTLHDTLGALGGALIVEALERLSAGELVATPQPEAGATYAKKLSRADGALDWRKDAAALERQVRAFDPWPGAWFVHDDARIRVLAARVEPGEGAPGTLVDDRLGVACGKGVLRLLRVQREGRAALDAEAFLRGYKLPAGTCLATPS